MSKQKNDQKAVKDLYMFRMAARTYGFQVPYLVAKIPDKGLGIVAATHIPKGALIWHCDVDSARFFKARQTLEYLGQMGSDLERREFLTHAYSVKAYGDFIIYAYGDAGLVNHSSDANSVSPALYEQITGERLPTDPSWPNPFYRENASVALRDILPGQEIAENYNEYYDPPWYIELCRQYGAECSSDVTKKYI